MIGIFFTAFSFITYVHYARSGCMYQDIKIHLDDELLEEHMFEIKVFSSETKEHELLSVINALCSASTKNKNKDKNKFKVLLTFEIMLSSFSDKYTSLCANLNCTDAYTVTWVNTSVFGDMYRRSCNGLISDLKCPSKSTTVSPNITAAESTTFFTTVDSVSTAHKTTTSLTTVSPNITSPENSSTVSSASTETNNAQNLRSTIETFSGVLVVSLLLNIGLFLLVLKCHLDIKKIRAEQANNIGLHGEQMDPLQ